MAAAKRRKTEVTFDTPDVSADTQIVMGISDAEVLLLKVRTVDLSRKQWLALHEAVLEAFDACTGGDGGKDSTTP
jgi:hypothetical protein